MLDLKIFGVISDKVNEVKCHDILDCLQARDNISK